MPTFLFDGVVATNKSTDAFNGDSGSYGAGFVSIGTVSHLLRCCGL
jgi:hypothetical protein